MIAAETTMGPVFLCVADLERTIDYWTTAIGLEVIERGAGEALLGSGERVLVAFREVPGARPAPRSTGLFHVALLLPQREDLARWLSHAIRDQVALAGASDHFVSEAIYLRDPDHHGIEIYADRPRELWQGKVAEQMTTLPLDVDDLLGELDDAAIEPFDALPDGTTVGHTHLRVADVDSTVSFYRDVLGFPLMAEFQSMAAFLGAGGYHHHVGGNIWESAGASPGPTGTARLRQATILVPDREELDRVASRVSDAGQEPESLDDGVRVHDPSGNALLIAVPS
jgi:catechol 2,3-dioxygenase